MYLNNSHIKGYFMRNVLLAILFMVIFAPVSAEAAAVIHQGGALAATAAKSQTSNQTAANMGAGGPGSDLRAISSPSTRPQTFTGIPSGALAGDDIGSGGGNAEPPGRVVMSGEPLAPIIGPEKVGLKLDNISVIARHVGYTISRLSYSPTVMDMPYTFALMNGNRKISTLYFDRSMTLQMVQ